MKEAQNEREPLEGGGSRSHTRVFVELRGIEPLTSSMPWMRSTKTELCPQNRHFGIEAGGLIHLFVPHLGHDPKASLLNKWNQLHACKNVFVTDGACMTSASTQNPSLTYMAITARAANYAVSELKKRNLK